MLEQIGAVFNQLLDALVAAGLPVDKIMETLDPILSKIMEVIGPIIGG